MLTWTDEACECLDRYLQEVDKRVPIDEREAGRLISAVRGQIVKVIQVSSETPVTLDALRTVLTGIGEPGQVASRWMRARLQGGRLHSTARGRRETAVRESQAVNRKAAG